MLFEHLGDNSVWLGQVIQSKTRGKDFYCRVLFAC